MIEENQAKLVHSLSVTMFLQMTKEVRSSRTLALTLGAMLGHMILAYAETDVEAETIITASREVAVQMWSELKDKRSRVQ